MMGEDRYTGALCLLLSITFDDWGGAGGKPLGRWNQKPRPARASRLRGPSILLSSLILFSSLFIA